MRKFFRYVKYGNKIRKNLYNYFCLFYNSQSTLSKMYLKTYSKLFFIYLTQGLFKDNFSITLSYCGQIMFSKAKISIKVPEPFEDSLIYILNENGFLIYSKFPNPLSIKYNFTYTHLVNN